MLKGLTSNLGQKITAILIAMLLWLYVFTLQGPEVVNTFNMKISIRNLPENTKVTSVLGSAKLVLRGSKKFMDEITPESIKAYIDLLGKKSGSFQAQVKFDFPDSVVSIQQDPETVTVVLQQIATKELPIAWKFVNQSELSVIAKNPVFNPQRLTISGPESEIQKFTKAQVTIDMRQVKEGGFRLKLPYELVDTSGIAFGVSEAELLGVSSSFSTIDVEMQVDRPVRSRTIAVQVVTAGNLPSDMFLSSLEIEPKNINIQGDFETLNKIGRFINTLPVNLNGIVVNTDLTVGLDLPRGIASDTKTIRVTLKVERLERKTISVSIDKIENPDNLVFDQFDNTVQITIEGPASVVDTVFMASGSVNLKGLAKGRHEVLVKVTGLPSEVTIFRNALIEVNIP